MNNSFFFCCCCFYNFLSCPIFNNNNNKKVDFSYLSINTHTQKKNFKVFVIDQYNQLVAIYLNSTEVI